MKSIGIVSLGVLLCFGAAAQRRIPQDLSGVRGFNYMSAETKTHTEHWEQYDPAVTERDMDYAKRLNLNQARVFLSYQAWLEDKDRFRKNLVHLVRAAHQRGIGVMPVVDYSTNMIWDDAARPAARAWAADLVNTIGQEPGLAFWDVSNEPDWPATNAARLQRRMALARYMAGVFDELDPVTPVTIGFAFEKSTEEMADAVDVLSFHDYMQTRGEVRATIARARALSARTGKPIFDTEIGCIARANPYDVTLQEHMNAGVGWYIWELMITKRWGTVHGVFYPDGTVRDPAIVAALMGCFRNRGPDVVLEDPDRENWVTKAVANARAWLDSPNPDWEQGLDAAETAANLLEAAQLVAMREPPTRQVDLLRSGKPDMAALRTLMQKYVAALEPYQKKK
jgi:hypothetical protein